MTEDPKFFYANAVEVALSAYDFSFRFMRQGPPMPGKKLGEPGGQQQVEAVLFDAFTVAMSPSHAKAVMNALIENIRTYEAAFGPIPMPKGKNP